MEKQERDFKWIWIPKEIWISKELTTIEKLFIVEINSLDNYDGCFAGNSYFSEFFWLWKARVSEIINSLSKKWFITIEMERKWRQIVRRVIRIGYSEKAMKVFGKGEEGYSEKARDNNTVTNNTNIKECFEEFWNLYPIKQGWKQKTEKLYNKIYKEHNTIIQWLQRHIQYWNKRWRTSEFIPNTPHASTFLNQRRWEDEIWIKQIKEQSYSPFDI